MLNGAAAALSVIIVHLESHGSISKTFEEKSKRALFFFFQRVEERKGGEEDKQEEKEEERKQGVTTPALVSILVQGVVGRHLSVKVATGRRVYALCVGVWILRR